MAGSAGKRTAAAPSSDPLWRRTIVFHVPFTGIGSVVRYTPSPRGSRRSTCRRSPPYHAVTVSQSASRAAEAGSTLTIALASRLSSPAWSRFTVTLARGSVARSR